MTKSRAHTYAFTLTCVALGLTGCARHAAELQVRDQRISELETSLADTQGRFDEAQEQIVRLTSENQSLRQVVRGLSGDVEQLEANRQIASSQIEAAEAALARLEAQRDALQQQRELLEADRTALITNLAETRRALEDLRGRERQAQARLDTFRNLLLQFRSMIEAGQVRVRVSRNRMIVELQEAVLFDSGRAELRTGADTTLAQVTQVLVSIERRQFQVAGHTDNVPIRTQRFPSNWELSSARALTVTHFMIERGMPGERISAAGYADTQSVAPNNGPSGRQQNRRIEIVLLPNLDELPDLSSLEDLR